MHYVIGDVHGCFKELNILVDKIEAQDSDAIIYFVGDWIDRGPQVADVMQWVVKNISSSGKYRSVRGNHDQEALDWYNAYFLPWTKEEHDLFDSIPETHYDFDSVVDICFDRNPEALKPFFDKVKSMPFNIGLEIVSAGGKRVNYRICHAWHCSDEKKQRQSNLYERNYWGNTENDEIIVHGHTPTCLEEYRTRGVWNEEYPGMIGYRPNAINVDGGCCYQRYFSENPCMLCGICLETLEEFYPYTIEEKFIEIAKHQVADFFIPQKDGMSFEKTVKSVCDNLVNQYTNKKPNQYRQMLLKRLGLDE